MRGMNPTKPRLAAVTVTEVTELHKETTSKSMGESPKVREED